MPVKFLSLFIGRNSQSLRAVLSFLLSIFTLAQSGTSPEETIRKVTQNELRAERQDDSHWMFRLQNENKNGQKEVDEVVETKNGDLKLPILINGHEPTDKQRPEFDRQLGRNSQSLRKALKDKNQDAVRSQQMLQMLPDAFTFSYEGRHGN